MTRLPLLAARIQAALLVLLMTRGMASGSERVESLIRRMTLEEKVGQLNLLTSDWDVTGPSIRGDYAEEVSRGRVGAVFNAYTADFTRQLQERAVRGSRLGIPLLFGYDVVHGHRTIFPIPLGEAASFDLEAIQGAARIAATEAAAEGIHWTFAPMVDVARDPRWGRVAEGAGEDPWLGSEVARARVRGFQGEDLGAVDTLAACAKHFAAYGAPQAGRDYHSVDLSWQTLHEVYLPPFRAAFDAGAATVMTAFHDLNGIPCTAHPFLLGDLLRDTMGFPGLVVTDYTSINELVPHGLASDEAEAGRLAFTAGVDMDMQGSVFSRHLGAAVRAGAVPAERLDGAVRRVLLLKERLGLLEDPFRYCDGERQRQAALHPSHLAAARRLAQESFVLLENRGGVLPMTRRPLSLAVVGPLADSRRDLIGSWSAAGDGERPESVLGALRTALGEGAILRHARGCAVDGEDRSGFAAALAAAAASEVVLAVMGESYDMSGEAASRTRLDLPGVQSELVRELVATGKPVVLVVMSGRPLALEWESRHVAALLMAWFPGTMGGPALADVLLGKAAPSGRLPVTMPRSLGQVPIFAASRNTGRPVDPARPGEKYRSRYLDSPNEPLYPFGSGRSYTSFEYRDLEVSPRRVERRGRVTVTARLANVGARSGTEVVQLYMRDPVARVVRPLRQLRGFQRVTLRPGQTRVVRFELGHEDLAYPTETGEWVVEPGTIEVYVGPDSGTGLAGSFEVR